MSKYEDNLYFKDASTVCTKSINNLRKFLYNKIGEASNKGEFFVYFNELMFTENLKKWLINLGYSLYASDEENNPFLINGISWEVPEVIEKLCKQKEQVEPIECYDTIDYSDKALKLD